MAIHASSTPAPADHRPPLLPLVPFVFRSSPPVDDPRSVVEIIDEIRREIEAQEVSAQTVQKPEVPSEPLSVADVPRGAASEISAPDPLIQMDDATGCLTQMDEADLARACHARRALEAALDHGTALLAALGLPQLVEPGSTRVDPEVVGVHLDAAIALLDAIDPDPDLEPSLGAPENHASFNVPDPDYGWRSLPPDQRRWAQGADDGREEDVADEPHGRDTDAEETLGWSASVSQLALGPNIADGDLTAPEHHGTGFVRCAPDDHEPNGDAEPSLARPEGFQFETGGDFDLEHVDEDEDGTDDGEDASHHSGRLRFVPRVRRTAEVAHV